MLDRILDFSIRHRQVVALLTLAAACAGVTLLPYLSIDAVPDVTENQVQINTSYPSFSPAEIEEQITFPIETALAGVPGLVLTRSLSRNGFSQVTAIFDDSVELYFARQQLYQRLLEAKDLLPPGADPHIGAASTALDEVYMWTVGYAHPHGKGAPQHDGQAGWQSDGTYLTPEGARLKTDVELLTYLRTVQDWIVAPQLKGTEGVAGIDAIGGYERQLVVEPDPSKLYAYGLSFRDLIDALERNNTSAGAGYVEQGGQSITVRAVGRLKTADDASNVVIGVRHGTPIHVGDVAAVAIGGDLRSGAASCNGEEAVIGTALKRIGANARFVAAAVDGKVAVIGKWLPPDIRLGTVLNRMKLVDAVIGTVRENLLLGAALVAAVLFVLLGNLRAALIVAMAIPLSILMMAAGMVQIGVSGNLMSLGAIDFGLIVDGAVIIVENCLRRLAMKQREFGHELTLHERLRAVRVAAHEMLLPSAFGQAIIIIVYLPIFALTGVEGKMFRPMATTVIFALVSAFVLSLTFMPAMVAIFASGRVSERESIFIRAARAAYAPMLRGALRDRWLTAAIAVATLVGAFLLFRTLGQEFVPLLDEGDFLITGARLPGTGITRSTAMQRAIENAVKPFPEVQVAFSKIGTADMATDPLPPNEADMFVMLKPRAQWPDPKETKEHLRARLQSAIEKLPGTAYEYKQPIEDRVNEMLAGVRADVAVHLFGDSFDAMLPAAEKMGRILGSIPGAADVKVEQVEGLPALEIEMDHAALSRYGVSVADAQDAVAIAVGGREAGVVFEGDRRFDIVVRLPEAMRRNLDALGDLPVPVPKAEGAKGPSFVPLRSVAKLTQTEGLNEITRENGKRRIAIQANIRGRDMATFVAEAQARIENEVPLPPGTWLEWGGQFKNLRAARERLMVVVPLCFFLIFVLLFSAFYSVPHALLVFSGVPLALSGGVLSLWLRGMPFSISAAVGFIALSGVAVLNGLVMLSQINHLRRDGMEIAQAVVEGSLARLRPVLTTALVASLGFVPMALATGPGAEVQKPLATVVIGGLLSSTLLTLLVLPALYRLFGKHLPRPPHDLEA